MSSSEKTNLGATLIVFALGLPVCLVFLFSDRVSLLAKIAVAGAAVGAAAVVLARLLRRLYHDWRLRSAQADLDKHLAKRAELQATIDEAERSRKNGDRIRRRIERLGLQSYMGIEQYPDDQRVLQYTLVLDILQESAGLLQRVRDEPAVLRRVAWHLLNGRDAEAQKAVEEYEKPGRVAQLAQQAQALGVEGVDSLVEAGAEDELERRIAAAEERDRRRAYLYILGNRVKTQGGGAAHLRELLAAARQQMEGSGRDFRMAVHAVEAAIYKHMKP